MGDARVGHWNTKDVKNFATEREGDEIRLNPVSQVFDRLTSHLRLTLHCIWYFEGSAKNNRRYILRLHFTKFSNFPLFGIIPSSFIFIRYYIEKFYSRSL